MSLLLSSKGRKAFSIPAFNLSSAGVDTPQEVIITFAIDGTGTSTAGAFNWYSIVATLGAGDDCEIRASFVGSAPSGTFTGAVDTWLALASPRAWSLSQATLGASSCTVLFQIRKVGETELLASGEIEFLAEVIS